MAREIVILTNPTSGRGRGMRMAKAMTARLRDAGCVVRSLVGRDVDEARDLAKCSVAEGIDTLAVVGGDGMVQLGAQAVAGTETALGVVPAGTGNDVARLLDIPRTDPSAASDVLLGSRTRRIDLARFGDQHFVTVMAAGFDAAVNERANAMAWPRGRMRYNLATLSELRVFQPIAYTLTLDGEVRHLEAMLVAVGNGPSFGGGLRITHGAQVDDGWLDVVVIRPMSKLELVRTYPKLYSGGHTRHPAYEHHRVRAVTVEAPGVVAYADGERVGPLPVRVEIAPLALKVLVP